jgi:hypothetical protein
VEPRSAVGRGVALALSALLLFTVQVSRSAVAAHPPARICKRGNKQACTQQRKLVGSLILSGVLNSHTAASFRGAISIGSPFPLSGDTQRTADQASTAAPRELNWPIPLPVGRSLDGYRETIDSLQFTFSVPPDSFHDESIDDNTVRVFHWDSPPANTIITLTESLTTATSAALTPFRSSAGYPLLNLPDDVTAYFDNTPATQISQKARNFAAALVEEQQTERAVVEALVNWVASHITDAKTIGNDAATVWKTRQASGEGYDNLLMGLLRSLGIPVRAEIGWVSAEPLSFPAPNHKQRQLNWGTPGTSGTLHTWVDIYFPGNGWVPFDVQAEKFFVDPHHIALYLNADATDLTHADGDRWLTPTMQGMQFGPALPDGNQADFPGDGVGDHVTLAQTDDNQLGYRSVRKDVSGTLLYSR